MELFNLIAIPILWVIHELLDGHKEGYLYNYRDSNDGHYSDNLHGWFLIQRAVILSIICVSFIGYSKWYAFPILILALSLSQPFIHGVGYYETIKYLSDGKYYPKGWLSNDNNSNAKFNIEKSFTRLYMAIGACIIYGIFCVLTSRY